MPSAVSLISEVVKLVSKLPAGTLPLVVDILKHAVKGGPKAVLTEARAAARMTAVKAARDAAVRKARK